MGNLSRRIAIAVAISALPFSVATFPDQAANSMTQIANATSQPSGASSPGGATEPREPDGPASSVDFVMLHSRIAAAFPDEFTRSLTAGAEHTIWFKGAIPAEAAEWAAALKNVVLMPDAGYSQRELEDYASRLLDAAGPAETKSQTTIMVTPLQDERLIHVTIGPSSVSARSEGVSAVETSVNAFVASNTPPSGFTVAIASVEAVLASPEVAPDGGRSFSFLHAGSWHLCTGAFPIKNTFGPQLGILTAGHCGGTGNYHGISDMFHPPVSGSQATTTTYPGGDFRWNHSNIMLSGYTYVGGTVAPRRLMGTMATPGIGDDLCGYGLTTGRKCDTVSYASVYAWIGDVPGGSGLYQIGPMRCTDSKVTDLGDSGGPWYYNYVAYGIHSGSYYPYIGSPLASCWSSVENALARFGIYLWTG